MTITYKIDNNLYINVTNKCPNACDFCIRNSEDAFEYNLWLEREPTAEEILKDIYTWNLEKFKQIVFCGFGEPLENIEEVLEVSKRIKEKNNISIRINTNGLANKIHNCDVTPRFKGIIDSISISLNAKNAVEYDAVCHSAFGRDAFPAILDFTKRVKDYVDDVQLSVVDCLPEKDIEECKKIADDLGVRLKIRKEVK